MANTRPLTPDEITAIYNNMAASASQPPAQYGGGGGPAQGNPSQALYNGPSNPTILPEQEGEFMKGFRQSYGGIGKSYQAHIGAAQEATGHADAAKATYAAANAPDAAPGVRVGSFRDVRSFHDLSDWAAGGAGQLTASAIQSSIMTMIGSGVGYAAGKGQGARIGAELGALGDSIMQQAGANLLRQQQDANASKASFADRAKAAYGTGVVQGAIDYIPERLAFGKALGHTGGQVAKVGEAAGATRKGLFMGDLAKAMVTEAGAEGAQNVLEQAQAQALQSGKLDTSTVDAKNMDWGEVADNAALGALGGGMYGVPGAARTALSAESTDPGMIQNLKDRVSRGAGAAKAKAGETIDLAAEKAGESADSVRDSDLHGRTNGYMERAAQYVKGMFGGKGEGQETIDLGDPQAEQQAPQAEQQAPQAEPRDVFDEFDVVPPEHMPTDQQGAQAGGVDPSSQDHDEDIKSFLSNDSDTRRTMAERTYERVFSAIGSAAWDAKDAGDMETFSKLSGARNKLMELDTSRSDHQVAVMRIAKAFDNGAYDFAPELMISGEEILRKAGGVDRAPEHAPVDPVKAMDTLTDVADQHEEEQSGASQDHDEDIKSFLSNDFDTRRTMADDKRSYLLTALEHAGRAAKDAGDNEAFSKLATARSELMALNTSRRPQQVAVMRMANAFAQGNYDFASEHGWALKNVSAEGKSNKKFSLTQAQRDKLDAPNTLIHEDAIAREKEKSDTAYKLKGLMNDNVSTEDLKHLINVVNVASKKGGYDREIRAVVAANTPAANVNKVMSIIMDKASAPDAVGVQAYGYEDYAPGEGAMNALDAAPYYHDKQGPLKFDAGSNEQYKAARAEAVRGGEEAFGTSFRVGNAKTTQWLKDKTGGGKRYEAAREKHLAQLSEQYRQTVADDLQGPRTRLKRYAMGVARAKLGDTADKMAIERRAAEIERSIVEDPALRTRYVEGSFDRYLNTIMSSTHDRATQEEQRTGKPGVAAQLAAMRTKAFTSEDQADIDAYNKLFDSSYRRPAEDAFLDSHRVPHVRPVNNRADGLTEKQVSKLRPSTDKSGRRMPGEFNVMMDGKSTSINAVKVTAMGQESMSGTGYQFGDVRKDAARFFAEGLATLLSDPSVNWELADTKSAKIRIENGQLSIDDNTVISTVHGAPITWGDVKALVDLPAKPSKEQARANAASGRKEKNQALYGLMSDKQQKYFASLAQTRKALMKSVSEAKQGEDVSGAKQRLADASATMQKMLDDVHDRAINASDPTPEQGAYARKFGGKKSAPAGLDGSVQLEPALDLENDERLYGEDARHKGKTVTESTTSSVGGQRAAEESAGRVGASDTLQSIERRQVPDSVMSPAWRAEAVLKERSNALSRLIDAKNDGNQSVTAEKLAAAEAAVEQAKSELDKAVAAVRSYRESKEGNLTARRSSDSTIKLHAQTREDSKTLATAREEFLRRKADLDAKLAAGKITEKKYSAAIGEAVGRMHSAEEDTPENASRILGEIGYPEAPGERGEFAGDLLGHGAGLRGGAPNTDARRPEGMSAGTAKAAPALSAAEKQAGRARALVDAARNGDISFEQYAASLVGREEEYLLAIKDHLESIRSGVKRNALLDAVDTALGYTRDPEYAIAGNPKRTSRKGKTNEGTPETTGTAETTTGKADNTRPSAANREAYVAGEGTAAGNRFIQSVQDGASTAAINESLKQLSMDDAKDAIAFLHRHGDIVTNRMESKAVDALLAKLAGKDYAPETKTAEKPAWRDYGAVNAFRHGDISIKYFAQLVGKYDRAHLADLRTFADAYVTGPRRASVMSTIDAAMAGKPDPDDGGGGKAAKRDPRNLKASNAPKEPKAKKPDAAVKASLSGLEAGKPLTAAERAEIKEYLDKVLGGETAVEFDDLIGHSGEYDLATGLFRFSSHAAGGTAQHEALHAWFKQLRDSKHEATQRVIGLVIKSTNSDHVLGQLRELLKDHPAALEQLSDPEEAAAYAFQFWQAGKLDLKEAPKGHALHQWFTKLMDYLRKVTGIMSRDDRAADLLRYFHEGRWAQDKSPSAVAKVLRDQTGATELMRKVSEMLKPLADLEGKLIDAAGDRLRDTDIPALKKIADMFHPVQGEKDTGFLQRARIARGRWLNQYAKAVSALDEAGKVQMLQLLRGSLADTPSPEVREAAAKVRRLLDDVYDHAESRGVPLNRRADYFPQTWDADYIQKNRDAYISMLEWHGIKAEEAKRVYTSVAMGTNDRAVGENPDDPGYNPFFSAANQRKLVDLDPAKIEPFLDSNVDHIMARYVEQAAKRIEYEAKFGPSGEGIHALLEQAKTQGATDEELAVARQAVQAMEGTLPATLDPRLKTFNDWMITYQNVRLLPLSILSQANDVLGIAARSGDMKVAWQAFKQGIKDMPKWLSDDPKLSKWDKIAMAFGVLEDSSLEDTAQRYFNTTTSGMTRAINDKFFKWTLLDGWNRSMRVMATRTALSFLHDHMTNPGEHSERFLRELGISAKDVVIKDGAIVVDPHNEKLTEAIHKFVDTAVLRPSPAHRTVWGSDPRFAIFQHLKQYTYSFHHSILANARHEADNGNMMPMGVIASYIPVAAASMYVKALVANGGELPGYMASWGFWEWVWNAFDRSGAAGLFNFHIDSLPGPTAEQALGVAKAASDGHPGSALGDAVPGHQLAKMLS